MKKLLQRGVGTRFIASAGRGRATRSVDCLRLFHTPQEKTCVVACSGNTASPRSRSATPAIFVHTPPAHVNSPLVGAYTTTITKQGGIFMVSAPTVTTQGSEGTVELRMWLIEFGSDGYYTALGNNSNASEQYAGLGQYPVTGNQLTVSDAKCWEFNGPEARTATYNWTLEGRMLTLKVGGGDLCSARKLLFTRQALMRQD